MTDRDNATREWSAAQTAADAIARELADSLAQHEHIVIQLHLVLAGEPLAEADALPAIAELVRRHRAAQTRVTDAREDLVHEMSMQDEDPHQ